jgi:hypothetical protein
MGAATAHSFGASVRKTKFRSETILNTQARATTFACVNTRHRREAMSETRPYNSGSIHLRWCSGGDWDLTREQWLMEEWAQAIETAPASETTSQQRRDNTCLR